MAVLDGPRASWSEWSIGMRALGLKRYLVGRANRERRSSLSKHHCNHTIWHIADRRCHLLILIYDDC
eukprot:343287-Pleurochrysis_carterae.AAC.7